jgi:hypothetical protein
MKAIMSTLDATASLTRLYAITLCLHCNAESGTVLFVTTD